MLTLHRFATFATEDERRLDAECRAARWLHHRLLDFEDQHQRVLDAAAETAAPGIGRVGRILRRLSRRARRAAHTPEGTWAPNPRPELAKTLRERLEVLRKQRNAAPEWKAACKWADEKVGDVKKPRRRRAKDPSKVKRRKTETDEQFAKRFELLTHDETEEHYREKVQKARRRTRREQYRAELYEQRWCYWGTFNALCKSVDQARKAVLGRRKQGLPADWRRPKYRDPVTLATEQGGVRVVERGSPWWTLELRVGASDGADAEWVRIRAKCGNWHDFDVSRIRAAKLTRRKDGEGWCYSLSVAIEDVHKTEGAERRSPEWADDGTVAFDWGHREHGHDAEREGLRAFVWRGDDGATGEVLIPRKCREALDEIDRLKGRLDTVWNARKSAMKLPERNRHGYRRRLMRSGVRTEEESLWLRWEMRYERRITARRKKIANLRKETYLRAVRELRRRYRTFKFERESVESIKRQQTEEETRRRVRSNRDLAARYEFVSMCERFGAVLTTVPARNTTRECPECGHLSENGPELLIACEGCGVVRDKDHGSTKVILRRPQEPLAGHAAE